MLPEDDVLTFFVGMSSVMTLSAAPSLLVIIIYLPLTLASLNNIFVGLIIASRPGPIGYEFGYGTRCSLATDMIVTQQKGLRNMHGWCWTPSAAEIYGAC